MNHLARTLGTIALTALVTCTCAVALTWPSTTEADDFAMQADGVGVDTTVVGAVEVTAAMVQDPAAGGAWVLEVKAHNTSNDSEATAEIEENVLKSTFRSEMSRAPSIPMVAWKTSDKVQLRAGETRTIRHPLPGWLSAQVGAANRPPKLDKNGLPTGAPPPSFSTRVASREDAAVQRQAMVPPLKAGRSNARPLPRNAYSEF